MSMGGNREWEKAKIRKSEFIKLHCMCWKVLLRSIYKLWIKWLLLMWKEWLIQGLITTSAVSVYCMVSFNIFLFLSFDSRCMLKLVCVCWVLHCPKTGEEISALTNKKCLSTLRPDIYFHTTKRKIEWNKKSGNRLHGPQLAVPAHSLVYLILTGDWTVLYGK